MNSLFLFRNDRIKIFFYKNDIIFKKLLGGPLTNKEWIDNYIITIKLNINKI